MEHMERRLKPLYWFVMERHIETELLPIARRFGVIDEATTLRDLREVGRFELIGDSDLGKVDPNGVALQCLVFTVRLCRLGWRLRDDPKADRREILGEAIDWVTSSELGDQHELRRVFEAWFYSTRGYLVAMVDAAGKNARRGAAGRAKIGDASKDKVRNAAATRKGLSKARAADEIALEVSLSPTRVLRLLSELFPGDSWNVVSDI